MDRRTLLAIGLILIVAILPSIFFPPRKPAVPAGVAVDSSVRAAPDSIAAAAAPRPGVSPALRQAPPVAAVQEERTVTVESPLYRYTFSTRGARLTGATLKSYRSFHLADSSAVQLIPDSSEFLAYRVVMGTDTVNVSDWIFEPSTTSLEVAGGGEVTWTGRRGDAVMTLRYRFHPEDYRFDVTGDVRGLGGGGLVVVGLGPRLRLVEGDSATDFLSYSVVTKARSSERIDFRSLDPGERSVVNGPFEWVAMKSKYFVAAILTIEPGMPQLGGVAVTGGTRPGKYATQAHAQVTLPATGGLFSYSVYAGPMEAARLSAIGHGFNDVNPYGWSIFRLIIQPASVLILKALLWMHTNLHLAYGWVIILFGIGVRLALWPLNAKAMRSGMAMQAAQPEIKMLQEKYKKDPQKMQAEIMKLYKDRGINPLGGCLPMLIPFPVLIAVWFVLANTIEFRGVSFLWLPDLARHDPYYIIPLFMGVSMFALSKLGQKGMPPNPQATMMLYMMPAMMTFFFLNLSSGVNLYYAVQNVTSLPQQWLIARERLRKAGKPPSP